VVWRVIIIGANHAPPACTPPRCGDEVVLLDANTFSAGSRRARVWTAPACHLQGAQMACGLIPPSPESEILRAKQEATARPTWVEQTNCGAKALQRPRRRLMNVVRDALHGAGNKNIGKGHLLKHANEGEVHSQHPQDDVGRCDAHVVGRVIHGLRHVRPAAVRRHNRP
jgi:hypothetical protein